jgi:hypothetical protein
LPAGVSRFPEHLSSANQFAIPLRDSRVMPARIRPH